MASPKEPVLRPLEPTRRDFSCKVNKGRVMPVSKAMTSKFPWRLFFLLTAFFGAGLFACKGAEVEAGFTSLFNGRDLAGWKLVGKKGEGYGVKDGVIYCAKGGGGNLFTEKEYANFILRVEYKVEPAANN